VRSVVIVWRSRSRIEDIKNLLEGIQYKPVAGRYKIYLIDEVHRLSAPSFAALLKILEEPPAHVIFLLATTDRQRIPDVIISRCLSFYLKNLTNQEIAQQLQNILLKEDKQYEVSAIEKVAQMATGSMRDALSLVEPLILHGETDRVTLKDVQAVFGYIDEADQWALINAICSGKTQELLKRTRAIAMQPIDFEQVLDDLMTIFHKIALTQMLDASEREVAHTVPQIISFSEQIAPEQVQLYYEIALRGKKDLSIAPNPQLGFEMTLLRMVAFSPRSTQSIKATVNHAPLPSLDWLTLVEKLPLTGFLKSLALNCSLASYRGCEINLSLDPRHELLYSQERKILLQGIISQYLQKKIELSICIQSTTQLTPAMLTVSKKSQQKQAVHQAVLQDEGIKAIQEKFDATIQVEAIHLNAKQDYE
jgi:DNA polymerase III subunit gamma/tau